MGRDPSPCISGAFVRGLSLHFENDNTRAYFSYLLKVL
jgi:hypothetical protein